MDIMMFIKLLGGLGLFLYGMDLLGDGLKKAAGNKLKDILNKVTSSPLKALMLGTIVTMIIQSSSATTVLVVGLVNAELMTLAQAAGVILGADIGTTITGQIIALDLSAYAPLFIGIGAFARMMCKNERLKDIADCILGFGILFFGISVMSDVLKPLANDPFFTHILVKFGESPLLGLFAGVFVTAIIQSSSASIGVLQALALGGAFAGVEAYDALSIIIPIVLGMNIGTCATALLSMIGVDRKAKQAAIFHLLTKTIGVIWMMTLLLVTGAFGAEANSIVFKWIIAISGNDPTQQIANFHTAFNVCNACLLIFLTKPIIRVIQRLLPVVEETPEYTIRLNDLLLKNPSVAISEVINEMCVMGELAYKSLNLAIGACLHGKKENIKKIEKIEKTINDYEKGIADFVIKLSALDNGLQDADFIIQLHQNIHNIERIGDYCVSMVELTKTTEPHFSENAKAELMSMYSLVQTNLRNAIDAFEDKDLEKAIKTTMIEEQINDKENELRKAHIARLNKKSCSPESGVVYLDLVADLERIGDYSESLGIFVKDSFSLLEKRKLDFKINEI